MNLADYIESNKQRLIERWRRYAIERLSLKLENSELVNHLPLFIDELVALLRSPPSGRPSIESARQHGEHRMRRGVDIGSLTEEMVLMGETIIELAHDDGLEPSGDEVLLLMRMIARGTAVSIGAYAAMRDRQLAEQATQHFSFIAHEIRNPLNNAHLAAQLLATDGPGDREVHLTTLNRALSHLSDLVDNSLLQARIFGAPKLQAVACDARELIDAACEHVSLQALHKGIYVAVDAEPFDLDADRKLIVSALTNLLQNAVKFSCDAGRVVIRARAIDERAVFEVEDECGGIAEDQLPRLFKPFVQLGADDSGFGLGLAIVKQAAESHGGNVRVVNMPSKGCRFVMEMPRRRQAPSAPC